MAWRWRWSLKKHKSNICKAEFISSCHIFPLKIFPQRRAQQRLGLKCINRHSVVKYIYLTALCSLWKGSKTELSFLYANMQELFPMQFYHLSLICCKVSQNHFSLFHIYIHTLYTKEGFCNCMTQQISVLYWI